MNYRFILFAFIVFAVTACVPVTSKTKGSYIRLLPHASAPAEVNEGLLAGIKVFYQEKPGYEFTEVGIIEALAYGKDVGLKDLFPELKKQAVLVGGKAIYKIEIKRHNQTGDTMHATAVAIVPR